MSLRTASIRSVHHQILLYGTFFLFGCLCPVIFFHTHFAKEYLIKNYRGYLHIYLNGRHFVVRALVDTGNHLYEPLTGKPVCLVEYECMKCYLEQISLTEEVWAIPYHTIGIQKGMLWGITADKVIFQNKWTKIIKSGCIIAFCHEKLSQSGEFSAIVHPDILEK